MTVEEVHLGCTRGVIAIPDLHEAQSNTGLKLRNEASPGRLSHLLCSTVEVRGIENEVDVGIGCLKAITGMDGNYFTILDTQQWLQELGFDANAKVECKDVTDANPADRPALPQQLPG